MVPTFYCYSAPHSVTSMASLPPSPMICYQRRKGPGPASLMGLHGVLAPARHLMTAVLYTPFSRKSENDDEGKFS